MMVGGVCSLAMIWLLDEPEPGALVWGPVVVTSAGPRCWSPTSRHRTRWAYRVVVEESGRVTDGARNPAGKQK